LLTFIDLHVLVELRFGSFATRVGYSSWPIHLVLFKSGPDNLSIWESEFSFSLFIVTNPVTCIDHAILKSLSSLSIPSSIDPLAFVSRAIWVADLPSAVPLTFVISFTLVLHVLKSLFALNFLKKSSLKRVHHNILWDSPLRWDVFVAVLWLWVVEDHGRRQL
jgi:hypothetical protein